MPSMLGLVAGNGLAGPAVGEGYAVRSVRPDKCICRCGDGV